MKFRMIATVLLLALLGAVTCAQDSKFFREKLGKPSELFRHKSGADVLVSYDDKGQVCSVTVGDPLYWNVSGGSFLRLVEVAEELVPEQTRGALLGKDSELGNCLDAEYKDYERVLVELNQNACHPHWVRIYFKRNSCPKPAVRLTPPYKQLY